MYWINKNTERVKGTNWNLFSWYISLIKQSLTFLLEQNICQRAAGTAMGWIDPTKIVIATFTAKAKVWNWINQFIEALFRCIMKYSETCFCQILWKRFLCDFNTFKILKFNRAAAIIGRVSIQTVSTRKP